MLSLLCWMETRRSGGGEGVIWLAAVAVGKVGARWPPRIHAEVWPWWEAYLLNKVASSDATFA